MLEIYLESSHPKIRNKDCKIEYVLLDDGIGSKYYGKIFRVEHDEKSDIFDNNNYIKVEIMAKTNISYNKFKRTYKEDV